MEYPKRKHPRLKQYDYSLPGYYYVTIHLAKDAPQLSRIIPGSMVQPPHVMLTRIGELAQQQLQELEVRFPSVKVDHAIIMPTHIHAILQIQEEAAGDSQRPTLQDIVGVFKSLTTRKCNQMDVTPGRKLFQTSFYETVLRNEAAYQACWRYLEGDPARWLAAREP